MISDVLFEALDDIRGYLDDPAFAEMYSGELRADVPADQPYVWLYANSSD
jgi:hypothetical protein